MSDNKLCMTQASLSADSVHLDSSLLESGRISAINPVYVERVVLKSD